MTQFQTEGHRITVASAGAASIGAALIHLSVLSEHTHEWPAEGVFLGLVAAFQFGWAGMLLQCRYPKWPSPAIAVNASAIALWVVSRTVGFPLPVGPAGQFLITVEPVEPAGISAVLLESITCTAVWLYHRSFQLRILEHRKVFVALASIMVISVGGAAIAGVNGGIGYHHSAPEEDKEHYAAPPGRNKAAHPPHPHKVPGHFTGQPPTQSDQPHEWVLACGPGNELQPHLRARRATNVSLSPRLCATLRSPALREVSRSTRELRPQASGAESVRITEPPASDFQSKPIKLKEEEPTMEMAQPDDPQQDSNSSSKHKKGK